MDSIHSAHLLLGVKLPQAGALQNEKMYLLALQLPVQHLLRTLIAGYVFQLPLIALIEQALDFLVHL